MTTLRQDASYPGTDNTAWPAEWQTHVSAGTTTTIVANGLKVVTGALGGYADYGATLLNDTNVNGVADIGCILHWDFNATNPLQEEGLSIWFRAANNWNFGDNPDTWVMTSIDTFGGPDIEWRNPTTRVVVAGKPGGTVPLQSGVSNYCHFEVQGAALRASYWTASQSEPTSWMLSGTMSTGFPAAGGRFGFKFGGGAAATSTTSRLRDLLIYDFNTPAPSGDSAAAARLGARPLYRMRRRL